MNLSFFNANKNAFRAPRIAGNGDGNFAAVGEEDDGGEAGDGRVDE